MAWYVHSRPVNVRLGRDLRAAPGRSRSRSVVAIIGARLAWAREAGLPAASNRDHSRSAAAAPATSPTRRGHHPASARDCAARRAHPVGATRSEQPAKHAGPSLARTPGHSAAAGQDVTTAHARDGRRRAQSVHHAERHLQPRHAVPAVPRWTWSPRPPGRARSMWAPRNVRLVIKRAARPGLGLRPTASGRRRHAACTRPGPGRANGAAHLLEPEDVCARLPGGRVRWPRPGTYTATAASGSCTASADLRTGLAGRQAPRRGDQEYRSRIVTSASRDSPSRAPRAWPRRRRPPPAAHRRSRPAVSAARRNAPTSRSRRGPRQPRHLGQQAVPVRADRFVQHALSRRARGRRPPPPRPAAPPGTAAQLGQHRARSGWPVLAPPSGR